jgi:hypothetical protein
MFPYFSIPSTQIAISASTFMTVAIAYERYLAVKDPLKYSQHMKTPKLQEKRLMLYLFIVLVLSVLINSPHFSEFEVRYVDSEIIANNSSDPCHLNTSNGATNKTENATHLDIDNQNSNSSITSPIICNTDLGENPYFLYYYRFWARLIATGAIPFVSLLFFNIYIYKAVKRNTNRRQRLTSSGTLSTQNRLISSQFNKDDPNSTSLHVKPMSDSTKRRDEENLSMVFVGIATTFLLCHSLKIILNLYDGLFEKVGATSGNRIAGYFSNFLIILNSAINMVIYCILNPKFRTYFLISLKSTCTLPCFDGNDDGNTLPLQFPLSARPSLRRNATEVIEMNLVHDRITGF